MTLYLHARLYRVRLRDLVATQITDGDEPPRPLLAVCPTCGETYFADPREAAAPHAIAIESWEALARLDGECPDHPHWFTVGS